MEAENTAGKLANEAELVEQAKTDDQAFEVLYRHYFPRIYGYLFKRTGNREVTEDLVSETFMKVFCNLKKYEQRNFSFGCWLYRIATNNLIDYYRQAGRRAQVNLEDIQELKDYGATPEEIAGLAQNRELVKKALGKLKGRYQEVLHLKFFAELSNIEIAETLGLSVNNTAVLVHRALKKFALIYKKYGR
jgi:RNA polymerase sigma-70 factor (ECF subfamily)